MARDLKLPKAPCLFATVDYAGKDEPDVIFYKEDNPHEKHGSAIPV
jgi:hypothetical protein